MSFGIINTRIRLFDQEKSAYRHMRLLLHSIQIYTKSEKHESHQLPRKQSFTYTLPHNFNFNLCGLIVIPMYVLRHLNLVKSNLLLPWSCKNNSKICYKANGPPTWCVPLSVFNFHRNPQIESPYSIPRTLMTDSSRFKIFSILQYDQIILHHQHDQSFNERGIPSIDYK